MAVQSNPDELRLGSAIVIQEGELESPLPLENTVVTGQIIGPVANVLVTQHFGNPFTTPIEITYLFPLPHDAAIVDYLFTIGARQVRAEMKELEAARRAYEDAADAGKRASIVEERRPNLYSVRIANIQPGEKIICELRYEQRLDYEDGMYEFVFPMGITPRYHSPHVSADVAKSADTAFAKPGEKVAPVSLSLSIDAGIAIADPQSTSHNLTLERQDGRHIRVALAGENIPNKDFVLRYTVAPDAVVPAAWSYAESEGEIVLINLLPPRLDIDAEPGAREFVFVIDRSGSMSHDPMNQAKNALRACLRALNPQDTFYIQAFDDKIEWLSQKAQPVTQAAVETADGWLDTIKARGGTEILPAIEAALSLTADAERQRYVVFLTDGSVSADDQAIRKIAKGRGSARIFTFGIGPSVNRFLLDKMAQLGRGKAEFIGAHDDIETTITRFQDRVSYPVLQDVTLEWGYADAWDTYPDVIPDLYVGEPVQIVTRMKRKGNAHVHLHGKVGGKPVEIEADIAQPSAEDATIGRLWARARLETLLDQQYGQHGSEDLRQQLIGLALQYRLLTPFTAFVAVDGEVTTGGEAKHVQVSVPLPEGLIYENFFGAAGGTLLGSVQNYGGRARGITGAAPAAPPMRPAPSPAASSYMASAEMADASALDEVELGAPKSGFHSLLKRIERGTQPKQANREVAPEPAPLNFTSIEERIKWLARTQQVDGSWGGDVEMTAAALLAFVRAGHTTRGGSYRQQVKKAANWLRGQLGESGFASILAWKTLAELEAATSDAFVSGVPTPQPTTDLENAILNGAPPPQTVNSLDDLRLAALNGGAVDASDALKQGADSTRVQIWLAVSKVS